MLRKTSVVAMKKLGFGERSTMENIIHEKVNICMQYIHEKKGKAFDMEPIMRITILKIIYTFLFGKRFESDDSIFEYISNGIVLYNKSMHPMLDLFPIVRFVQPFRQLLKDIVPRSKKWKHVFNEKITECMKNSHGEENFVTEFAKQTEGKVKESELYYVVNDFIQGGTEPGSTTLLWAIVLIGNHRAVQDRLHEEIDSVVPKERVPSLSDKLPYFEATILEIMRVKTITPLSLPHKTMCDTEVAGYFIPKKTQVRLVCFYELDFLSTFF